MAAEHAPHHDHDHSHAISADADRRALAVALALLLGFMVFEVVAGVVANSLALISDAGHMLTDAGAIALSLVAMRLAQRPAKGSMTFGLKRVEILSAQVNGITLLAFGVLIVYEAIHRLVDPPAVDAWVVLVVALVGIVVNIAATWVLAKANRQSLNVEGSYRHVLTDLYAFIGTAIAAAVILLTGFDRADPIASIVVAALMLHSSWILLKASGRVLLEAAPAGVDPDEIGRALAGEPDVVEVHDLHVWEVTSGFPALSVHVLVKADVDCHATRVQLEHLLHERFEMHHTTLQVDHAAEPELLHIQPAPPGDEEEYPSGS